MALSAISSIWFRDFRHCRLLSFPSVTVHQQSNYCNMEKLQKNALFLFKEGVASVKPCAIIRDKITSLSDEGTVRSVIVNHKEYTVGEKTFIIGFGKAVYGMACVLENMLGGKIQSGILSVPFGTQKTFEKDPLIRFTADSKIRILEGAQNNIPDEDACRAAEEILQLVKGLDKDSLLFVLISGGGSALLPMPVPEITFEEKRTLINLLASKGANIVEMNTVRKRLSVVKGGGLAIAAYPAQVVGLILSDVIDDPIESIASGPTCPNTDKTTAALNIIIKYGLEGTISNQLRVSLGRKVIDDQVPIVEPDQDHEFVHFKHVNNVLVGNNTTALEAVCLSSRMLGFNPTIMSCRMNGEARNLGYYYAHIAQFVCGRWIGAETNAQPIQPADYTVGVYGANRLTTPFFDMINECKKARQAMCLAFGGESTVNICGHGIGGRNQEVALAFVIELHKQITKGAGYLTEFDVCLLSAGTDGIDGPTPAAGALGYLQQFEDAKNQGLDPEAYLNDNNSYVFFNTLNGGKDLVVTGHTGTNVMDLQILLIQRKA